LYSQMLPIRPYPESFQSSPHLYICLGLP
jgi:hypothetical protein